MDKRYSLPRLIIVSGISGTGKTTLAQRLSNHFALPLISKDMIKEGIEVFYSFARLKNNSP